MLAGVALAEGLMNGRSGLGTMVPKFAVGLGGVTWLEGYRRIQANEIKSTSRTEKERSLKRFTIIIINNKGCLIVLTIGSISIALWGKGAREQHQAAQPLSAANGKNKKPLKIQGFYDRSGTW
jgi:hypothetical protein